VLEDDMRVRVWGTRGSVPSPIMPQAIREKMFMVLEGAKGIDLEDPQAIRDYLDGLRPIIYGTAGGNTTCIEIQADGKTIIIDAGSGIRPLGDELMKGPCGRGMGEIYLLFTHLHWDHIQGLPFFLPAYIPGNKIYVHSVHNAELILDTQMRSPTFSVTFDYMRSFADFEFRPLREGQPITIGNVQIDNMKLPHPDDAYAYRLKRNEAIMVFASDAEYKKLDDSSIKPFIRFYSGADVLFFDSQYTVRESLVKQDWGHSSALIGADMARRAGVKRLVLCHHDPTTSDRELVDILEQTIAYQHMAGEEPSCEVIIGREGLTFDLEPIRTFRFSWVQDREAAILVISNVFDQENVTDVLLKVGQTGKLVMSGA
ncbi:MAG: MBL fold metallo-hydrolase, partial [Anaerolineales bacterium]